MKLECGGLVRADREVLDGKIDPSEYVPSERKLNREVRINFTAGGETNQVREHLLRRQQGLRRGCSQSTLARPPFCLLLDMG